MEIDFQEVSTRTLKQELFVLKRILEKIHLYGEGETTQCMLAEFNSKYFPMHTQQGLDETQLAKLTEIFDHLNKQDITEGLGYGEPMMMRTTVFFQPKEDKARIYKTRVLKELKARGEQVDEDFRSKDVLVNGVLKYEANNNELRFGENKPIKLSQTSDYGRLLILLMSNLNQVQSYTKICDTGVIDYKAEDADPETDQSIKRQVNQLKNDLVDRLKKTGMKVEQINEMIVARNGYKMNKLG